MESFPPNVMSFFIKLYVKTLQDSHRHKKRKIYLEAKKSWNLLNGDEKKHFVKLYLKCKSKYENKLLSERKDKREKSAKRKPNTDEDPLSDYKINDDENILVNPMKVSAKNFKITSNDDNLNISREPDDNNMSLINDVPAIEQEIDDAEGYMSPNENKHEPDEPVNTKDSEPNCPNYVEPIPPHILYEHDEPGNTRDSEPNFPIYVEPIPPHILTGREVFELMSSVNKENNLSWEILTRQEKKRYIDAINYVKKDYIKQYEMFLRSLSSQQLFEHYIKEQGLD